MLMRRHLFILIVFSSLLSLCGCSSKQRDGVTGSKQLPGTVNFGRLSDYSPDMLDVTDSLRLEESEDMMLGAITQCEIVGNVVYLLDYQRSRTIASYSLEDGKLQNYKQVAGDGPGEFQWPFSFDVDEQNGFLYIFDKMQAKILKYNLSDWSFVEDIAIPVADVRSFAVLDNERILYYLHGQENDVEVGRNQVAIADRQGHVLSAMYPDPGSGRLGMGSNSVFKRTDEGLLFVPYFSNREYLFQSDTLSLVRTYEWENASIVPLEFFPEEYIEVDDLVQRLLEEDCVRSVYAFHAGEVTAIKYWLKRQLHASFFNSQTGRALNCKVTDEFPVPVAVYEDKIVGAVMDDEGGITLYFYRYK